MFARLFPSHNIAHDYSLRFLFLGDVSSAAIKKFTSYALMGSYSADAVYTVQNYHSLLAELILMVKLQYS